MLERDGHCVTPQDFVGRNPWPKTVKVSLFTRPIIALRKFTATISGLCGWSVLTKRLVTRRKKGTRVPSKSNPSPRGLSNHCRQQ